MPQTVDVYVYKKSKWGIFVIHVPMKKIHYLSQMLLNKFLIAHAHHNIQKIKNIFISSPMHVLSPLLLLLSSLLP